MAITPMRCLNGVAVFARSGRPAGFPDVRNACRLCNHRRHAQRKVAPTPEEYRALVRRRVARKSWQFREVFERGLIAGG